MTEKTIYDLELHETLELPKYKKTFSPAHHSRSVMRVPGGWIYTYDEYDEESHGVFVPYNSEFHPGSNQTWFKLVKSLSNLYIAWEKGDREKITIQANNVVEKYKDWWGYNREKLDENAKRD